MAHQPRDSLTEMYKFPAAVETPTKIRQRMEKNGKPISRLFQAILQRDESAVSHVLEESESDVNERMDISHDYSPLILACAYKMVDSVMALVQNGAEPNQTITFNSLTPLAVAIQTGEKPLVQYLVEDAGSAVSNSPNSNVSTRFSPVHVACYYGHVEIVRYFAEDLKLPLNTRDSYGVTPLLLSLKSDQWDVVQYLLQSPLNDGQDDLEYETKLSINHKSVHADTALTVCMRKLKTADAALTVARRLLDCGADPLIPTVKPAVQPTCSLALGVQDADYDFVKLLVEKCRNFNEKGGATMAAAALALKLALQRDKQFAELLMKKLHISPNVSYTNNGDTSMHALGRILRSHEWTDNEYEEHMVRLFIQQNGDVNEQNADGESFMSLIEHRRDIRALVTTLRSSPGKKKKAARPTDGDNPRPNGTPKKRGNNQSSESSQSQSKNKKANKSSRKKAPKSSTTHPRTTPASKRKNKKKKKQQKEAIANGDAKDDEKERENVQSSSSSSNLRGDLVTQANMDIMAVSLSDLSAPDRSESEMTATSSSAVEDDSDGFRKVETRSARNKKSKKQQQQQQRQFQVSRTNGNKNQSAKKPKREASVPSSPRIRKAKFNAPASASRVPREKNVPPARRVNSKSIHPQQVSRRIIKTERPHEKAKPVRAQLASWANQTPIEQSVTKLKVNGAADIIEPREVSKRDDEIPEPLIPPRLLSPRDKTAIAHSHGTPPIRGRSPSVGTPSLTPAVKCNGKAENDTLLLEESQPPELEEKSPSEKPNKVMASAPTRPPMARPSKPPKFPKNSAISSLEHATKTRMVMSSIKTHEVTFLPKEVPQQDISSSSFEQEMTGGLQTDQSSKSGHSTESIPSGGSSPASSQHQPTSTIQRDRMSPVVKPMGDLGFSNVLSSAQSNLTPQEPTAEEKQQPAISVPAIHPQTTEKISSSSLQSPLNPVAAPFAFFPNPAVPNPMLGTPLGVPNVGFHPMTNFPFVHPSMITNPSFGMHPIPQMIPTISSLPHLQMPNMGQPQPIQGMTHHNQVPMMPFQFPVQAQPHPTTIHRAPVQQSPQQHMPPAPPPQHPTNQQSRSFQPLAMGHQHFPMGPAIGQPTMMQPLPQQQMQPSNMGPHHLNQQFGVRQPQPHQRP